MAIKNNELSGRAIIICIFIGFLTVVLVFLFVKRQIIRFTLKNRRGPHLPIGVDGPKHLRKEIDRRLELIKEIKFEPLLINSEQQFSEFDKQNNDQDGVPTMHIYRMKAVDDLKYLEELLISIGGNDIRRSPRSDLRQYLLRLTQPNQVLYNCDLKLLHQFVDLYMHARHDDPVFGSHEYQAYVKLHRTLQKFLIRKHNLGSKNAGKYLVRNLSDSTSNVSLRAKLGTRVVVPDSKSGALMENLDLTQETCV